MLLESSLYQSLPSNPGIYLFLDEKNNVLYVGKAKNLKKRVSSYFLNRSYFGEKTKILVSQIKKIEAIIVHSEVEALLLEAKYVKKHKPKYNVKLTDDKSYPLIRITIKDDYPKVVVVRKNPDKNSKYFGPFPNSSALYLVLKTARRIFPFQSVFNHQKRICLYYHLGLCPCPPVFDSKEARLEYRKNIRHLINFLNGNTGKVLKDLEKERSTFSKNENFEKAQLVQKKIDAIILITSPLSKQFDYRIDLNLEEDKQNRELLSLMQHLSEKNVEITSLERIECYDISNILGTNPVGSMVVFLNGKKSPTFYRKFKIRNNYEGPNDFAMMKEVLSRRLNHPEWPYPDFIVVDGGKGQISAALSILEQRNFAIPIVGLAKRNETIITSDFQEINLPEESPALHLMQRIRDEAHRFAITYHKLLRSKEFIS